MKLSKSNVEDGTNLSSRRARANRIMSSAKWAQNVPSSEWKQSEKHARILVGSRHNWNSWRSLLELGRLPKKTRWALLRCFTLTNYILIESKLNQKSAAQAHRQTNDRKRRESTVTWYPRFESKELDKRKLENCVRTVRCHWRVAAKEKAKNAHPLPSTPLFSVVVSKKKFSVPAHRIMNKNFNNHLCVFPDSHLKWKEKNFN